MFLCVHLVERPAFEYLPQQSLDMSSRRPNNPSLLHASNKRMPSESKVCHRVNYSWMRDTQRSKGDTRVLAKERSGSTFKVAYMQAQPPLM
ncbi:hypothetical protein BDV93DRAFT_556057 [Ceratobasidium sp. AG-I]|nr:hypothetical protein BDV93DRAFT_556057 [Ceratobasidium sp. AG-I]